MTAVLDAAADAVVFRAARQDKPWGHEVIFAAGEAGYVGKVIHVSPGQALSLQYHEQNANKAGTLYQDLPTIPGTTMRWHLKHRGRAGVDTMRVMIGARNGTLTQSGPNIATGNTAWQQYTGVHRSGGPDHDALRLPGRHGGVVRQLHGRRRLHRGELPVAGSPRSLTSWCPCALSAGTTPSSVLAMSGMNIRPSPTAPRRAR